MLLTSYKFWVGFSFGIVFCFASLSVAGWFMGF